MGKDKVFNPQKYYLVKASEPHPEGTEYKVSLGTETWKNNVLAENIIKIQIVQDGVLKAVYNPSYPSHDFAEVNKAVQKLLNGE